MNKEWNSWMRKPFALIVKYSQIYSGKSSESSTKMSSLPVFTENTTQPVATDFDLVPTTGGLTEDEIKAIQRRFLMIVFCSFFAFVTVLIIFVTFKTRKKNQRMRLQSEEAEENLEVGKPVFSRKTSISANGARVTLIERRASVSSNTSKQRKISMMQNPQLPTLLESEDSSSENSALSKQCYFKRSNSDGCNSNTERPGIAEYTRIKSIDESNDYNHNSANTGDLETPRSNNTGEETIDTVSSESSKDDDVDLPDDTSLKSSSLYSGSDDKQDFYSDPETEPLCGKWTDRNSDQRSTEHDKAESNKESSPDQGPVPPHRRTRKSFVDMSHLLLMKDIHNGTTGCNVFDYMTSSPTTVQTFNIRPAHPDIERKLSDLPCTVIN